MIAVSVGWQIFDLTHSALALGLVGLVQFFPLLALLLVVGPVIDRYDRRTIARCAQALECAACIVLFAGAAGGFAHPVLIYAMVTLFGVGRAFEQPALSSLLPNIVVPELIPAATARMSMAQQTAIILGPALGGVLFALNPAIPYGIAAVAYASGAVLLAFVRPIGTQRPRPPSSIFGGLAFMRRTPVVLGAVSLDLFAVLLGGATALLPLYARDILAIGPSGLGLLRTAPAVGALASSIFVSRRPIRRHAGRVMFGAVISFGVATIVFGLSRNFALSFAALVLLGASDVLSVVIRSSLVALRTPDDMRGRVNAVNSLFIGTSNQLGEFESGVTAAWLGPVEAVVAGGIGSILVALVWSRLFPDLARTGDLHEMMEPVAAEAEAEDEATA